MIDILGDIQVLEAFEDAFITFTDAGERMLKYALDQAEILLKIRSLLLEARQNNRRVHTVGMGRSGLCGKFLAELLKLRRVKSSVIGTTLAKPVNNGDVVFAISGSGWTKTTTLYTELCLERGATVIAFTATKGSKLDRLSDYSLYLLGKPLPTSTDYIARKISGDYRSPLAPMGSISEFSTLLVSAGIANMIDSEEPIEEFKRTLTTIINVAKSSLSKLLIHRDNLNRLIAYYEVAKKKNHSCFFGGMGLLSYISDIISIRFQHLGIDVSDISDWILRKKEDVLTILSGSGEASILKILAEEGKRSGMKILSIVGNDESTIAKLSDAFLLLEDIEERKKYFELGREELGRFIPAFEISCFILYESIIAELANRFGITEEAMKEMHANIE
ncbi:MAG: SIS domain-containing protein [Candidatus Korarchaeota archaeon]|nr:SIS domain-containing protein [Thermoproteota archaeon]